MSFWTGFEKRAEDAPAKPSTAKKLLAGGAIAAGAGLALYGGHKALGRTEWARRGASGAGLGSKLKGALYGHADAKPTKSLSWWQNRTNQGDDFQHDNVAKSLHTDRGAEAVEHASPHFDKGEHLLRHNGRWQTHASGQAPGQTDVAGRARGVTSTALWDKRPAHNASKAHHDEAHRTAYDLMRDR